MIGCLVFRKVCHNECWKEVIGHYSVFIKLEELRVPFQKMREKNSPMVTHIHLKQELKWAFTLP